MTDAVNVSIGGTIDGLVKALQAGARAIDNSMGGIGQSIQRSMQQVETSSNEATEALRRTEREAASASNGIGTSLKGLSNLLGPLLAGLTFHKLATTVLDFADNAEGLANTAQLVGTTATAISRLHAVITPMGIDTGTLDVGMKKLAKTMTEAARGGDEQASALAAVGVSAQDLKTMNIEQVMAKISDSFMDAEDGATKTALATALMGRSGADLIPFLNMGSEAMKEQGDAAIAMGSALDEGAVQAGLRLDNAWDNLTQQGVGLKNMFSEALAPALEFIAEAFTDSGNTATDFGTVFKGVATLVIGATSIIQQSWNVVSNIVGAITIAIASIVDAIGKAAQMDWSGAKAALDLGKEMIDEKLTDMTNRTGELTAKFKGKMDEMWGGVVPKEIEAPKISEGGTGKLNWADKGAGGGAAAAAKKEAAEAMQAKRDQFELEMELLRNQMTEVQKGSEQKLVIQQQMLDKVKEMYGEDSREYARAIREQAKVLAEVEAEKRRIKDLALTKGREQANFEIDSAKQHGEFLLATGQVNAMRKLQMDQAAEEQRYQMQLSYFQARLLLMATEPQEVEKINSQIEQLNRDHKLRMQENDLVTFETSKAQWDSYFDVINSSFSNTIQGMIFQGTTLREAMGSILQSVLGTLIQTGVKMATSWAATQLGMTSATVTGAAVRTAAEVAAGKASVAANAGAAIKNIMNKAAEVFANVYNAIAGIPYVGPFLAPVMAVAAGAAVVGMVGKVASAEGGWDRVPYDGAQAILHKEEMVLPAPLAEGLRNMVENGGQRGGVTIHALDRRDVQRYFDDSGDILMRTLASQAGNNPGGF